MITYFFLEELIQKEKPSNFSFFSQKMIIFAPKRARNTP